jgi:hypothetical protein
MLRNFSVECLDKERGNRPELLLGLFGRTIIKKVATYEDVME